MFFLQPAEKSRPGKNRASLSTALMDYGAGSVQLVVPPPRFGVALPPVPSVLAVETVQLTSGEPLPLMVRGPRKRRKER